MLSAVHDRARREKRTAGEVASDLIRESLTGSRGGFTTRNGVPVLPSRRGAVTNDLVRSIRDESESDRSSARVSVLIALLDTDHDAHDRVHEWFGQHAHNGYATCAITENGFVRVVSQSRYRNPVPSAEAVALLTSACRSEGHPSGRAMCRCDSGNVVAGTIADHRRVPAGARRRAGWPLRDAHRTVAHWRWSTRPRTLVVL